MTVEELVDTARKAKETLMEAQARSAAADEVSRECRAAEDKAHRAVATAMLALADATNPPGYETWPLGWRQSASA